MCAGGVRASPVSCWTRVLSSALSREIGGMPGAPPPEPEPPRWPRPPPDRPPLSPAAPRIQSWLNPISSGFCVNAGFKTHTPATVGGADFVLDGDCAVAAASPVNAVKKMKARNGRATPSGIYNPHRTVAHRRAAGGRHPLSRTPSLIQSESHARRCPAGPAHAAEGARLHRHRAD